MEKKQGDNKRSLRVRIIWAHAKSFACESPLSRVCSKRMQNAVPNLRFCNSTKPLVHGDLIFLAHDKLHLSYLNLKSLFYKVKASVWE